MIDTQKNTNIQQIHFLVEKSDCQNSVLLEHFKYYKIRGYSQMLVHQPSDFQQTCTSTLCRRDQNSHLLPIKYFHNHTRDLTSNFPTTSASYLTSRHPKESHVMIVMHTRALYFQKGNP